MCQSLNNTKCKHLYYSTAWSQTSGDIWENNKQQLSVVQRGPVIARKMNTKIPYDQNKWKHNRQLIDFGIAFM